MKFDADRLLNWKFARVAHSYTARDAIVYALGVGLPFDAAGADNDYLLEDGLRVLPSYAVTLATPGMWVKEAALAIDWMRLLHTAQSVQFHAALPANAEVISTPRIKSLFDRGVDKGAVCILERRIEDAISGVHYSTIKQTLLMRGNGGFGGEPQPRITKQPLPSRSPDHSQTIVISDRAALIYRLSGDLNPLHVDAEVAIKAGFERPILHGLASYGTVCAVIMQAFCDNDPARLKALDLRFSGVVFPGDPLEIQSWQEGESVLFEARVNGRSVLDQGIAVIKPD